MVTYQVKPGDTLGAIATRFGVSVAAIAGANHLSNLNALSNGQVLQIPNVPPMVLVVTPAEAPVGSSFELKLTAVQASAVITFVITGPGGGTYTGAPHSPSPDGQVSAVYRTSLSDPTGEYMLVASGAHAKSTSSRFLVDPVSPPSTAAP